MFRSLFLISFALSSAACSQSGEETTVPPEAPTAGRTPDSAAGPLDPNAAKAVNFVDNSDQDGGERTFAYSWPAAVSRIPALATRLAKARDEELAGQKAQWQEQLSEFAGEDCVTCKTLSSEVTWKVATDLPDYLSLTADIYLYTGGAHGMSGLDALVWDKKAGREVELFASTIALETALGKKLCDALDRERARRRGAPVVRDDEWSTDCPSLNEATVIAGSSNGKTFDRIGVYFGPYVAGAYAEGPYELTFPVTASIIDAVKPEYASAFGIKR